MEGPATQSEQEWDRGISWFHGEVGLCDLPGIFQESCKQTEDALLRGTVLKATPAV